MSTEAAGATLEGYESVDSARVEQAVAAVKRGDTGAARVLYVRYGPAVRRYVALLVRDPDVADDVMQTTFVKVLVGLGGYESTGVSFDAWLFRVARNAALDELRRRKSHEIADLDAVESSVAPQQPETTELLDALATLPHPERAVVVLRHIRGLTTDEIAGRLSASEATVQMLHKRGRDALRDALGARGTRPQTLERPVVSRGAPVRRHRRRSVLRVAL